MVLKIRIEALGESPEAVVRELDEFVKHNLQRLPKEVEFVLSPNNGDEYVADGHYDVKDYFIERPRVDGQLAGYTGRAVIAVESN